MKTDTFRRLTAWLVVLGAGVFMGNFFLLLVRHSWGTEGWFLGILENHYPAIVGLPTAGIAALCLVVLLKYTVGPIEFEAVGLKFRGASGPIVMWVFCFLAIAVALWLLW